MKQFLKIAGWIAIFFCFVPFVFAKTGRIDLEIILRAASNLWAGENMFRLSDSLEHTKIPLITMAFIPLAKLGTWWASRIWDLLLIPLSVGYMAFLAYRLPLTDKVSRNTLLILTLVLLLNQINTEIWTGQTNIIIASSILAAGVCPNAYLGGVFLVIGLSIKPPFLLFLPWVFRETKSVQNLIAGSALAVLLLVSCYLYFFGTDRLIQDHLDWLRFLPLSTAKHLGLSVNYGFPSLFHEVPGSPTFFFVAGLLLAIVFTRQISDPYVCFSVIVPLAILCSPMAWKQNYVICSGFILLLLSDFISESRATQKTILGFALLMILVGFGGTGDFQKIPGVNALYHDKRLPFWCPLIALLLWGSCRVVSSRMSKRAPSASRFRETS